MTAIKVYTSDEVRNGMKIYGNLNTQLRAGTLDDYNRSLNKLLNEALDKLPKYNGNKVYRGVHGNEAVLASQWKVGETIHFKDFKSSSKDIKVAAYDFSYKQGDDVVIEIVNAKGVDVCAISCSKNEMEVLLTSNQKFIVKEIRNDFQIYDQDYSQANPFLKIIVELK